MKLRKTTIGLLATSAIFALASGACSIFFSASEEQCTQDEDCRARGAGFENSKCSSNVCSSSTLAPGDDASGPSDGGVGDSAVDPFACAKEPLPQPDPNRKLDLTIRYTELTSGEAPTGAVVRLCAQTDNQCANPRNTIEGNGQADAGPEGGAGLVNLKVDGTVTAKVEYGFEGFFEVKSSAYAPTFRYSSPPMRASKTYEQLILRPSEITYLADLAIGKPNAYDNVGHGLLFLFARDCNQKPLAGVTFTTTAVDPTMQVFFVINTTPSVVDKSTDGLGRGGFFNVPPGLHSFTAEFAATKQRIGSVRVLVRAGAATTVDILPSP